MKELTDRKHRYDKAYSALFPKSRSWRLRFFHWLTQGRIILEEENKVTTKAYQSASGQTSLGQLHSIQLAGQLAGTNNMNLPGITFKITSANGGTIVTVSENTQHQYTLGINGSSEELYIIPDGVEDFDRELGKIITMYRMKQK